MVTALNGEQNNEFATRGSSQRHFARLSAMLAVGARSKEVIEALQKEKVYKVYIGRVRPVGPPTFTFSIGTQDEMSKFKTAFLKAMG